MNRDLSYERANHIHTHEDGVGIKCNNFEICETVLPLWWFDVKACYICTNCDILFGKWENKLCKGVLKFDDDIDCTICFDTSRGVSYPNCNHKICIACFKRCFYGNDDSQNEPAFPYPDIEEMYYKNPDDTKWITDFPLLKEYHQEWNRWDNAKQKQYDKEDNLRKCSICRR
jgi:hypothetical protein